MQSITQLTVLTLIVVILAGAYVNHSDLPIVLKETSSFTHE